MKMKRERKNQRLNKIKIAVIPFLLILLLTPTLSMSQQGVVTLLTGLEYPKGLWVNGDKLYLTETAGRNTSYGGKISLNQYDIPTGVKTELVNNPINSDAVVVASDGRIYLTSYQETIPGQIGKVSVVDPQTYIETHLLDIEIASIDMFIDSDDNILIIGSSGLESAKSIYLLPVGDYTNPSVLLTGLGMTWSISKSGDYVYFSGLNQINRFNINNPSGTLETFLGKSVMSMSFSPQYLYYADYFGGTVGRIDIQTKADETLISGLNNPYTVRYDGVSNKLYFLEGGTDGGEYKDGTLKVVVAENLIDATKWADLEFITRIEGGALRSEARSSFNNPNIGNNLTFIDPNNVTSIKADVTVTDLIRNSGDFQRARIHGFFYNDGSYSGNGNVRAEVAIGDNGGGLRATYSVGSCPDLNCTSYTPYTSGPLGSVTLGTPHTLSISWDGGTQFSFKLDNNSPVTYTSTPPTSTPPIPFKAIATHVASSSTVGGFVSALFDDVYINGSSTVYDNFSSSDGLINKAKWRHYTGETNQALEIVREQVSDGVYGMALRGYGSFANNGLNLMNGQNFKELQADLTVEQFINTPLPNPAGPQAELWGSYYNDGTGGSPDTDSTGDIRALAGIRHNGTQPVGFYTIVKCTQPDCNIFPGGFVRLYYYEDPKTVGPDLVGKSHRVSIRWDEAANKFIFGFDGRLTTYPSLSDPPLPTNIRSPMVVRKGALTRVASGPSGEGYVSAQFANIATVVDTDGDGVPDSVDNCPTVSNPIVAQWKDINGNIQTNSQPDFDGDGVGNACDLCPQTSNDGGPCSSETGDGTASTSWPIITATFTYNGPDTYLVPPDDCNNVVLISDPPISQNCRRIPPYILTVFEELGQDGNPIRSGYGKPGGDWKFTRPGTSWTISCNLREIFDEAALKAAGNVKITPMYTFFDTDRGLDPAGNCAQIDICVDTTKYNQFQGTMVANQINLMVQEVKIDIKPGSYPNTINLGSHGVIPVAILSSATFDARTVKPESVTLAGATVKLKGKGTPIFSYSDVNGDGRADLIVNVLTDALQLTPGDTEAVLVGVTTSGAYITGKDTIRIVPAQ